VALTLSRRAHRRVSRRRKGSRSRRRAARNLARVYERVSGTRRTHHHTVARRLVREHPVLAVEDLPVRNLIRSARGTLEQPGTHVRQKAGLNREILDPGRADFVRCLQDKVEESGNILVRVDPYGTSQRCPACGAPAPKPFYQRVHRCENCGLVEDRDVAAAQVIANRAFHILSGSDESRDVPVRRHGHISPRRTSLTLLSDSATVVVDAVHNRLRKGGCDVLTRSVDGCAGRRSSRDRR
jgi:putative transposase